MKPVPFLVALVLPLLLVACAGGTANPVFNTAAKKAYIYSPHEKQGGLGVPPAVVGATGDVKYCGAGMSTLVTSRRREALAAIADACGGEDKYSITGEMAATSATASFMGVDVQCTGNAGRMIVFKCKGAEPRPTGFTK